MPLTWFNVPLHCSPTVCCCGVKGNLRRGWQACSPHCNNRWCTLAADMEECITVHNYCASTVHDAEQSLKDIVIRWWLFLDVICVWCPEPSRHVVRPSLYCSLHILSTRLTVPHMTGSLLELSIAFSHAHNAISVSVTDVTCMAVLQTILTRPTADQPNWAMWSV